MPERHDERCEICCSALAYTLTLCLDVHRNDRNINVVAERKGLGAVFRQHHTIPALKGRSAWVILDTDGVTPIALCPKDMTKGAKSVAVR